MQVRKATLTETAEFFFLFSLQNMINLIVNFMFVSILNKDKENVGFTYPIFSKAMPFFLFFFFFFGGSVTKER